MATNTGQTPYTGATVLNSLSGVLPDAAYNGDAAATSGQLSYVEPVLAWTGALSIGASVTLTYSITVNDPDTGDKFMTNSITSAAAGSTCPVGGTAPACSADVRVLVPELSITKTVDTSSVAAGNPVHYTVTVTNTGETPYLPATFTDSLVGVLDDASYAGDAVATSGTLEYTNQTLAWSGSLPLGASAIITYSVVTAFPGAGDRKLDNTVLSGSAGANCADGTDALCSTTVDVVAPELTLGKTADTSQVTAGEGVHYTITASNTGLADYPAATLTDSLLGILDDGVYNGDGQATMGALSYVGSTLRWTGPLAMGDTVVITYSITVSPAASGDRVLTNSVESTSFGSTCAEGSVNPLCTSTVTVDTDVLTLTDVTSSFTLTGLPGSIVTQNGAVSMTVTTNSFGGYVVTVQAAGGELAGQIPGNGDTIPIDRLSVRANGTTLFTPLSAENTVLVYEKTSPSAPGGDAVSDDYQIRSRSSRQTRTRRLSNTSSPPSKRRAHAHPTVRRAPMDCPATDGRPRGGCRHRAVPPTAVAKPAGHQLSIAVDNGRESTQAGDTLTYTITVTNLAAKDARGLWVTQSVPTGASFESGSKDVTPHAGTVVWNLNLKANKLATRETTMTVSPNSPTDLLRLATVACVRSSEDGPPLVCATDSDLLPAGAAAADKLTAMETVAPARHTIWFVGGGLTMVVLAAFLAFGIVRRRHRRAGPYPHQL